MRVLELGSTGARLGSYCSVPPATDGLLKMPLTRDKIMGSDPKSMVYRFVMMDGNRPIVCSVSNAVFNYLEKTPYPTRNADALFLRWRETIEKATSDKFDSVGSPDDIHLFLKDLKRRRGPASG